MEKHSKAVASEALSFGTVMSSECLYDFGDPDSSQTWIFRTHYWETCVL